MTLLHSSRRLALAVAFAAVAPIPASAQMVGFTDVFGGFESGLGGWAIDEDPDNSLISTASSTIGVTEGSSSLAVETGADFGRELIFEAGLFDPVYNSFLAAGAEPEKWSVDFDVTFTQDSWANLQSVGTFFSFGGVGDSDGGFEQTFNNAFVPVGQASFSTVSIPATALLYTPNSPSYSFGINTNGNLTLGPNGEGVTYYLDNVRLTFNGDPAVFVEDQLFSWETPDDPGTPGVNEQLEGWVEGFEVGTHVRSITSDSATDGVSALRIDTALPSARLPDSGFTWGSQFTLDASGEGDPLLQGEVTSFIDRVNAADKIAFDVTAPEDQFPNSPGFLQNFIHIADDTGAFFQGQLPDISLDGTTQTVEIALSELDDFNNPGTTVADGLNPTSQQFTIAIASNADDNASFSIDNLRLLVEVVDGVTGDYNGDGVVDGADYTLWRDNVGQDGSTLLNRDPAESGLVGTGDYDAWVANFGATALSGVVAVPEPTTLTLLVGLLALGRRRGTA